MPEYRELVAYQELSKLGFADLTVGKRQKLWIVLTEDGVGHPLNHIPGIMIDVCRRMSLRGWVEWKEGWKGVYWARLTDEGRAILIALDATYS